MTDTLFIPLFFGALGVVFTVLCIAALYLAKSIKRG